LDAGHTRRDTDQLKLTHHPINPKGQGARRPCRGMGPYQPYRTIFRFTYHYILCSIF
jgi:hypothetical protein